MPSRGIVRRAAWSLVDQAATSLSTLVIGLFALAKLSETGLAHYSYLFLGLFVAMLVPQQLQFLPLRLKRNLRESLVVGHLGADIQRARWTLAGAAGLSLLAGLPLAGRVPTDALLAGAAGTALAACTGSISLHVRGSLHMVGRSRLAAMTSTAGLAVVIAATLAISLRMPPGAGPTWVPFAILAAAQLVVLALVQMTLRGEADADPVVLPPMGERLFYLTPDIVLQSAGYLAIVILGAIAGPTAVATLEASRIVVAPVSSLIAGVGAVLTPTIVRAMRRDAPEAFMRRLRIQQFGYFMVGIVTSAVVWAIAPLIPLVLNRNIDVGLTMWRAVAAGLEGSAGTAGWSSVALRLQRLNTASVVVASGVNLFLVWMLAPSLGALAIVAGAAAGSLVRVLAVNHLVGLRSAANFRDIGSIVKEF